MQTEKKTCHLYLKCNELPIPERYMVKTLRNWPEGHVGIITGRIQKHYLRSHEEICKYIMRIKMRNLKRLNYYSNEIGGRSSKIFRWSSAHKITLPVDFCKRMVHNLHVDWWIEVC